MTIVTQLAASRQTVLDSENDFNGNPVSGVEFFHIYTDETIGDRHMRGVAYLRESEKIWTFDYSRIVLIDNYNPTQHVTTAEDILGYLASEDMSPDYWAYEGSLVENAQVFLESVTDRKLRKNYLRYIEQHNKYPCSLLTASWYLTRLGYLDAAGVIQTVDGQGIYEPVDRLLNLLPQGYESVEERARTLIHKSEFSAAAIKIEDLFYPIESGRAVDVL